VSYAQRRTGRTNGAGKRCVGLRHAAEKLGAAGLGRGSDARPARLHARPVGQPQHRRPTASEDPVVAARTSQSTSTPTSPTPTATSAVTTRTFPGLYRQISDLVLRGPLVREAVMLQW
jgi:hypothetical protein